MPQTFRHQPGSVRTARSLTYIIAALTEASFSAGMGFDDTNDRDDETGEPIDLTDMLAFGFEMANNGKSTLRDAVALLDIARKAVLDCIRRDMACEAQSEIKWQMAAEMRKASRELERPERHDA